MYASSSSSPVTGYGSDAVARRASPQHHHHGNSEGLPANYSAIQATYRAEPTSPEAPNDAHKASAGVPRIRRRNRAIQSCLECRRRKLKCDKQSPCSNCTRFRRDCLFLAPAMDAQSQQKLAEIKEKMGALEKGLESTVASRNQKAHLGGGNVTKLNALEMKALQEAEEEENDAEEDEDRLEPTPLADRDNVYEESVDDELMDLGVQMVSVVMCQQSGSWWHR